MGRFGHENGPFWMLAGPFWSCFFFHWGRFGQGRFGLRGPFSTFIGAVLAMGRFGRFPFASIQRNTSNKCFHRTFLQVKAEGSLVEVTETQSGAENRK